MTTIGSFTPSKWILILAMLGLGAVVYPLHADVPSQTRTEVSKLLRPEHRFLPIQKEWRKEVEYLVPCEDLGGYSVLTAAAAGAETWRYFRQECYHAGGKNQIPKLLRFHPSGYLQEEIDTLDREQFIRTFYPNGTVKTYLYWREGRWLQGYDISPDGKVKHWLRDGNGERVTRGSQPGFRVQRWYHQGRRFLEKRYEKDVCTKMRLDLEDKAWDMLVVTPTTESLRLGGAAKNWDKIGGHVWFQKGGDFSIDPGWPNPEREKARQEYPKQRKEFLNRYGELLTRAGRNWEELGIGFLRSGAAWPK
jgi:hypothetical protein